MAYFTQATGTVPVYPSVPMPQFQLQTNHNLVQQPYIQALPAHMAYQYGQQHAVPMNPSAPPPSTFSPASPATPNNLGKHPLNF